MAWTALSSAILPVGEKKKNRKKMQNSVQVTKSTSYKQKSSKILFLCIHPNYMNHADELVVKYIKHRRKAISIFPGIVSHLIFE